MVCSAGKITQEIDNTECYKREAKGASTSILRPNLCGQSLCPPHAFKLRSVSPHQETVGHNFHLSPKPGKPASSVMSHLLHSLDCKAKSDKLYLCPNNLCSNLLLLLCFDCLWHPSALFMYLFAGGCVSFERMT